MPPDSFALNLYSLLGLCASGILAIAFSRITKIHPAFFFVTTGALAAAFLGSWHTVSRFGIVGDLAHLGALFAVFLAGLNIRYNPGKITTVAKREAWQKPVAQAFVAISLFLVLFFLRIFDLHASIAISTLVVMSTSGLFSELAALVAVTILSSSIDGNRVSSANIIQIVVGTLLILLTLVSLLPQTLRYLMRRFTEESYALYYLLLTLVIAVITATYRMGLEPVIGAYAAGFVLARFVADDSKLLDRLRFTGESIIIPAFFLTFGFSLSQNLAASPKTVLLASAIVGVLILAAYLQRRLTAVRIRKSPLFLVLVYVGYARGIIPLSALQLLLLVAAISEIAALLINNSTRDGATPNREKSLRILLPVSNPETIFPLVTLAGHLGDRGAPEKIYPLSIVPDDANATERIRSVEETYNRAIDAHAARALGLELTTRIHNDRIAAVWQASRELLADRILLGLGRVTTLAKPKSYSFLEALVARARDRTIIAAHAEADFSATTAIHVIVAGHRLLGDASQWLDLVANLAHRLRARLAIFAGADGISQFKESLAEIDCDLRTGVIHAGLDLVSFAPEGDELVVAIIDRPESQGAAGERIHSRMPEMMLRAFSERNFLLVYPPAAPGSTSTVERSAWQKFRRTLGFA